MKKQPPTISEAEWTVMQILWDEAPQTAAQVIEALGEKDWSPRTIKTLLGRLVKKGALSYRVDGREYLYRPRVAAQVCARAETRSFLQRVFGGSVAPLVAHMASEGALSEDEYDSLRAILDEHDRTRGRRSGR